MTVLLRNDPNRYPLSIFTSFTDKGADKSSERKYMWSDPNDKSTNVNEMEHFVNHFFQNAVSLIFKEDVEHYRGFRLAEMRQWFTNGSDKSAEGDVLSKISKPLTRLKSERSSYSESLEEIERLKERYEKQLEELSKVKKAELKAQENVLDELLVELRDLTSPKEERKRIKKPSVRFK